MDKEVLGDAALFQKLLVTLVPVVVPFLLNYVNNRFGWKARLSRDAEAYRELSGIVGGDPSEEQRRVLGVLQHRAFASAKRSMEQNEAASKAFYIVFGYNFVVIVLNYVDLYYSANGETNEMFHDLTNWLNVILWGAFVVVALWLFFDENRATEAKKLEIEYWDDERERKSMHRK